MLSVNTNLIALNAQNNLSNTQSSLATSIERLSSGLRINSAADDAAGYAIANRFTSQINGLSQAVANANDGVSLAQTASGGLSSIGADLQTIRSLAVESANGTNSSVDRASLQAQASQLLQEITRIASTTQFNGVNLLDGSFSSQFQVGANAGQTVSIAIASAQTKDLGTGAASAVASNGIDGASASTTLKFGDLVINGSTIEAPTASLDTASYTDNANSAIAKAAAINASSAQTGVTAVAETNYDAGTSMTSATVGTQGTLTINGVSIGTVVAGATTATTRSSIVAAINAKSGQTGVVAVDTGNDKTGITLEAADGRNITVAKTGLTDAQMGLATDGTHVGAVALQSNSTINITSNTSGLRNWGFNTGSFTTATAYVASEYGSANALASGDVVLNGVSIGATLATQDTASSTLNADSAIAKAAAINAVTSQTGVTATANANVIGGQAFGSGTSGHTGVISINGISIGSFTSTNSVADRTTLINQINGVSGQTGVTASVDSVTGGLQLTAKDGRNIDIVEATGGNLSNADLGISATGNSGQALTVGTTDYVQEAGVTLSSAAAINVSSTTGNINTDLGIQVGTYGSAKSGESLASLDISSVDGANKAIVAIDNAINQVNQQAGALGAYQNRFTAAVSNLEATGLNLTAARSGIQDTNFAQETSNLSRSQILQQAGTAMLAQANQMGQIVLSLLK